MPDQSTILSLPHILPSQAQKHVTHNEALRLLDVMVQLTVLQRSLSAPPVSPALGDRYIVATGPTGDWAGHPRDIALWNGTAWEFFNALQGWRAYVVDEAAIVIFDGTDWTASGGGAVQFTQVGIGMAADATKKLAVEAPASLFTNPGGSHQLALNKGAAVDTASALFQQNYVTRAEVGLVASNDLTVKVSPDGTTFYTAATVDKDNGRVSLDQPARLVPMTGDAVSVSDGFIWYNATTGKFRGRQGGSNVDLVAAGGGSVFADADFRVQDNLDATKQAAFQVSGLTSGTTRTYTLPDTNGEVALLSGAQTFAGDKTFSGVTTVRDSNFYLTDLADPAKSAQFRLDDITSGFTRTFTLPNSNGQIAILTAFPQTFLGQTTFAHGTLTFGSLASASTIGVGTGATTTGVTKTVDIGTAGLSGSTTTVTLGSGISGALGATIVASPTLTVNSASVAMPNADAQISQVGIGGATADATNRLSVNAPGVLFNHAGSGVEATLNKSAAGDNARITFKTGFSTRAQFGLSGSDDFALRVSADGTAFNDGFTVAAASGQVALQKPVVLTGQASDPISPGNGTVWYNSTTGQLKAQSNGRQKIVDGQIDVPWLTPVSGDYVITTMGSGTATSNVAGAANRFDLYPFVARGDIIATGIAINCTTAVGSALGKMVIYDSDANGRPNALIVETATVDLGTTGVKTATIAQTLRQGETYWLGLRSSSTATTTVWHTNGTPDINGGQPSTAARKVLRRTLTFATPAPTTWGFLASEILNATAPAIWLRV